jgi:restriction system protein
MAIPDFQATMLPLLRHLADGAERTVQETFDALAAEFGLTEEERRTPLPSGRQSVFLNRIAWAKHHLKVAGLIESARCGVYRITGRGKEVLQESPPAINLAYLARSPEYARYRAAVRQSATEVESVPPPKPGGRSDEATPEEYIDIGRSRLRKALASELLERIGRMPPAFFETLVVDLLVSMGYGGSQRDAGQAIGGSGDGGVDGIIKEDRLGLEAIYIQAKRWERPVGRPEIQQFAGALQGQRARKGVFITTSSFTREAEAYAKSIQSTIVLVDGAQLAELMIDHGVGVTLVRTYEIKRLDSDYFTSD